MQTPFEEDYYGKPETFDEGVLEQIDQEQQARDLEILETSDLKDEEAAAEEVAPESNRGEGGAAMSAPSPEPEPAPEPQAEPEEQKSGPERLLDMSKDVLGSVDTLKDMAMSPAAGAVDWGVDLINKIPGVNVPKAPKFENEVAQSFREINQVLVPTIFITRGLGVPLKGATVGNTVLGNPLARFIGGTALDLGVGAGVDYVASTNEKDDNIAGSLKKSFPKTFGWISDDIATLDKDSPDVKRNKNLTEGAWLGLFSSGIEAVSHVVSAVGNKIRVNKAIGWIPENEKSANYMNINQEIKGGDVDEVFATGIAKRDFALDEIGEYNLNNATNFDEPMLGVHDVYSGYESAVRTTDNLGIVAASMDVARIGENADTLYGRVGSVMSDGAIKYALDGMDGGDAVIRGLARNLQDAGEYGYRTANGKYISHKTQLEYGEKLAADWADMNLDDLRKAVQDQQSVSKYGTPELSDEGYAGVMKLIKKYNQDFASMDYFRASGIVAASMSGQVSDFAQTMRLMDETAVVERAQSMILDRVEFLMAQKGMTSYSAGRALNMLNIFNRAKRGLKGTTLEAEIAEEAASSTERMKKIALEAKEAVATMRNISQERPEMLKPFMLAYDMTDGDINSMTKLNNYMRQSTGILSKAFFDGQPEIPSAFMQAAWGTVYNSVLSSIATPIKAVIGNSIALVERPIATFAGAFLTQDMDTIQRGLYMYSNIQDSLAKGFTHMKHVWDRAITDPKELTSLTRSDFQSANLEQIELMNSFADAKAAEGLYGPQAMMVQIEAMEDMAQSPWFKFGINAMAAFDGFTQAMIGNAEARGRAFDAWKAGALEAGDKGLRDTIAQNVYDQMFDKAGNITDKAVSTATKEVALNLESKSVDAISALINRAPVLKPFMLFPKTSVNDLKWAGSHNPIGLFRNDMMTFGKPFKEQPIERVQELLTSRGLPFDENAEAVYNTVRAELKGRKAIGTLAVGGTLIYFMNDSIRGNGHYDKERQKLRQDTGWKPRTIKVPGVGWVSYENMGAISTWVAFVADVADNIGYGTDDSGTLDNAGAAEMFNKAGYILSANLTNKTFLAGLEPMFDMLSGNPAAMNRWAASFGSGTFPLSGMRNDFSRLLAPQMKEMDQELLSLLANRNPIAKNTLPDVHDWIDGGIVGQNENFFGRVYNTFMPWKVHPEPSERKTFLQQIEFDARPSLRTNGKGVELTPEERSQVTSMMGERQDFGKALDRIMQSNTGREFRRRYREAQRAGLPVDREIIDNLHREIEAELRLAQGYAVDLIQARDEIKNKQYYNSEVQDYMQQGDLEGAQDFMSQYPQYQYLR